MTDGNLSRIFGRITPGRRVNGPMFTEPVEILTIEPLTTSLNIIVRGIHTQKVFKRNLTPNDLQLIRFLDSETPEDEGDNNLSLKDAPVRIEILPPTARMGAGHQKQFTAFVFSGEGVVLSTYPVFWEAEGGEITEDGVFTAGQITGTFAIKAVRGDISADAVVVVEGPRPRVPLKNAGKRAVAISWNGVVPRQKFPSFAMKVLSGLTTEKGLEIRVRFDLINEEGLPPKKLSRLLQSLNDLGLDDFEVTREEDFYR